MQEYLEKLAHILEVGHHKGDRTGTGTVSDFGTVMRFDLTEGKVPVVTTKKIFLRSVIHELIWFISGSTDIKYLKDNDVSIWDSWTKFTQSIYSNLRPVDFNLPFEVKEVKVMYSYDSGRYEKADQLFSSDAVTVYLIPEENMIVFSVIRNNSEGVNKGNVCRYFETKTKKPEDYKTHLLAGSIGEGAYGAMWRKIKDVRIEPKSKEKEMLDKGFKVYYRNRETDDFVFKREIDQLENVINLIKTNPDSRRIILSAFDPRMVDFCELPPCHSWVVFWTRPLSEEERIKEQERLGLKTLEEVPTRALRTTLLQRSGDYPVGIPFNFTQYSILTHMIAQVTNTVAEELVHVVMDSHIYDNQVELVEEQLELEPFDQNTTIWLNPEIKDINDFTFDDIKVEGYDEYHPSIKYPVAI